MPRPNVYDRDVTLSTPELTTLIRLVTDQVIGLVECEPDTEQGRMARRTLLDIYDPMLEKLVQADKS